MCVTKKLSARTGRGRACEKFPDVIVWSPCKICLLRVIPCGSVSEVQTICDCWNPHSIGIESRDHSQPNRFQEPQMGNPKPTKISGSRNSFHPSPGVKKRTKKRSEKTQTLRAGCSKAEPKILAPQHTPFPGARDGQNLISWRWSIPLPTDPLWWGSMHAISSYRA